MKYALYSGCVSKGGCPELYPAALKVADRLGIELEELTDVGCNGAGVLPQYITDPINARTFAKAEKLGLPIMTICSTCQGVMTQANHRLQEHPEYREEINREYLAEEGLEYQGNDGGQASALGTLRGHRHRGAAEQGHPAADGPEDLGLLRLLSRGVLLKS